MSQTTMESIEAELEDCIMHDVDYQNCYIDMIILLQANQAVVERLGIVPEFTQGITPNLLAMEWIVGMRGLRLELTEEDGITYETDDISNLKTQEGSLGNHGELHILLEWLMGDEENIEVHTTTHMNDEWRVFNSFSMEDTIWQ